MKKKVLVTAVSVAIAGPFVINVQAEEKAGKEHLSDVVVEAEAQSLPAVQSAPLDELVRGIPTDSGDFLRNMLGVSGTRMGGHGIDPIIRGQSQTRLNILLDGAYIHGGCPNRMDPPTAYSPLNTYDEVTVIRGSQTVQYGGGGSGGTVLFERRTPRFQEGERYRAKILGGFTSNSETKEIAADVALGSTQGFARGLVSYKEANNYEDGDGKEVRSAAENRAGTAIFGYTPDAATRLELSLEATREDDALFPGAGMDSPFSDADNYRLRFERETVMGPFSGMQAELYSTNVSHRMDNFSLRQNTGMKAKVPTSSDTWGGRISGDIALGDMDWTFGLDLQQNEREADKFTCMGCPGEPAMLQSVLWPGADLDQTGVFAEMSMPVGGVNSIKAGLRYDRVEASISRGDQATSTFTPNQLYAIHYANVSTEKGEDNVGGFLRYEHSVGGGAGTLFASISRSVRTADATERYLANAMGMMGSDSWVGNPEIEPEKHHQLELGLTWSGNQWNTALSVYYNDVKDFILRDKSRGQEGILVSNGTATIYRNVDARFLGGELEGVWNWNANWSSRLTLAYVQAQNEDDDRPIAQIPPVDVSLSLDYARDTWSVGGVARANAKQTRADLVNGSGLDTEETPSWAVLDLYGSMDAGRNGQVSVGVNNVFDKTYALHVNRANQDLASLGEPQAPINEPGREFWVRAELTF